MKPLENPNPPHQFAHPIEAEFARLLDFYHIPWLYEPVTFPLDMDEEGNLRQAFTPDFYLPNTDVYIELTTRRQANITDKHRKIRRLRQLYPQVSIRLLNRRQMRGLLAKYGMDGREDQLIGDPDGPIDGTT